MIRMCRAVALGRSQFARSLTCGGEPQKRRYQHSGKFRLSPKKPGAIKATATATGISGRKISFIKIIGMSLTEMATRSRRWILKETKSGQTGRKIRTNEGSASRTHPYQAYEGTKLWRSIDKAITSLVKNGDLSEQTRREYIVGYLVKSVSDLIA